MKRSLTLLSGFILVTACGGGGGGGGGDHECKAEGDQVSITDANATTVSIATLNAMVSTLGLGYISDHIFTNFGFDHPAANSGVINCQNGGSYTLQVNDTDQNGQVSNGDVYSFVFKDCRDENLILNGSFTVMLELVTNNSPNEAPSKEKFIYQGLRIRLEDPQETRADTLDGEMALDLSQNVASKSSTLIVQGATLKDTIESSIAAASGSFTLTDYIFQEERNDSTQEKINSGKGKLNSSFMGGSVSFEIAASDPFKTGCTDDYPYTGMLTVTGACDSKVTLNVVDNTKVQLSVGSTVIDKTWQQLKEAGLSSGVTTQ